MIVGIMTVELYISGATTLKEKRRVLKSIIDRIRSKYNVSISEVDNQDLWQRATLGVAAVSNETSHVSRMLDTVIRTIENNGEADLVDYSIEIL
ncbi:protein of unknown function DUF503 [Desulforamulus reducens MI-1]|uniref:DUF503 domain-containing protein n=1 Tax=Desulforamulus reducens (strain ATCC BAA-1160 / DSM 100696 / MI-1) TaxID=349161 RepID=A4J406_DESRM|nr:DUF503 domain-containing protein [Desulforamulus reducens]ABO49809.1 protein of unknown function DUF503 [Desulforamulus reducens MI-1]